MRKLSERALVAILWGGLVAVCAPAWAADGAQETAAAPESSWWQPVIDVQHLFPQYRAVANDEILRADITRTSAAAEAKLLGSASGAIKCLFSDPSNKECYQSSMRLATDTGLSADELVAAMREGYSDIAERLGALADYISRLDDKAAALLKAAKRAHVELSRHLPYLKDQIASGDATAFELYKKAADYKVNLQLLRENLERYSAASQNSTHAMYTILQDDAAARDSDAGRDCNQALTRYAFRVERLHEVVEIYEREYDLLHMAALTQEVREDEGYTPNFLYFLLDQAQSGAHKLAAMAGLSEEGNGEQQGVDSLERKRALSLDALREQVKQASSQNQQLSALSDSDREHFSELKAELSRLQDDNVALQKELAYYEAAMQLQRNQIEENKALLTQLEWQKKDLDGAHNNSLTPAEESELKEYQRYIAQLESEIEAMRQSYLEYAEYRNVLNIEVQ